MKREQNIKPSIDDLLFLRVSWEEKQNDADSTRRYIWALILLQNVTEVQKVFTTIFNKQEISEEMSEVMLNATELLFGKLDFEFADLAIDHALKNNKELILEALEDQESDSKFVEYLQIRSKEIGIELDK